MADAVSIKALTIPVSMLASILGGSAFLTGTRSDLNHLTEKVSAYRMDYKENEKLIRIKISQLDGLERAQDARLTRMESKQDLILQTLQQMEKRIEKRNAH